MHPSASQQGRYASEFTQGKLASAPELNHDLVFIPEALPRLPWLNSVVGRHRLSLRIGNGPLFVRIED